MPNSARTLLLPQQCTFQWNQFTYPIKPYRFTIPQSSIQLHTQNTGSIKVEREIWSSAIINVGHTASLSGWRMPGAASTVECRIQIICCTTRRHAHAHDNASSHRDGYIICVLNSRRTRTLNECVTVNIVCSIVNYRTCLTACLC